MILPYLTTQKRSILPILTPLSNNSLSLVKVVRVLRSFTSKRLASKIPSHFPLDCLGVALVHNVDVFILKDDWLYLVTVGHSSSTNVYFSHLIHTYNTIPYKAAMGCVLLRRQFLAAPRQELQ